MALPATPYEIATVITEAIRTHFPEADATICTAADDPEVQVDVDCGDSSFTVSVDGPHLYDDDEEDEDEA